MARSPEAYLGLRLLRKFSDEGGHDIRRKPGSESTERVDRAYFAGTAMYFRPAEKYGVHHVGNLDFGTYRVLFDDGDVLDMGPREVFECAQLYDAKVSGKGVVRRNVETMRLRLDFSSDIF